jgi:hypothetical protein
VFSAPVQPSDRNPAAEAYRIRRKPEYVQRAVWHPVYRSDFVPGDLSDDQLERHLPWDGTGWKLVNRRVFQSIEGLNDSAMRLQLQTRRLPLTDECFYNRSMPTSSSARSDVMPVGDIRLAAVIRARGPGLASQLRFDWRGHSFEVHMDMKHARLRMMSTSIDLERQRETNEGDSWTILDEASLDSFAPSDEPVAFEFWHADQSLNVWLDGSLILEGTYEWSGKDRFHFASARVPRSGEYPQLEWTFDGAPLSLHHVELDRDLFYRADRYGHEHEYSGSPALATSFENPARLNSDQFFMCGDNSSASHDGRTWGPPEPWTGALIDPTEGVVNRRLILGRAFFVYLPSIEPLVNDEGARVIPNFGEMRFIR